MPASSVTSARPSAGPATATRIAATAAPWLGVIAGMGVATHSVVRYELGIVLTYVVLVVLLGGWLILNWGASLALTPVATGWVLGGCLAVAAVLHVRVRPYTYLTTSQGWTVRWIFCAATLLAAALLVAAAYGRLPVWWPLAIAVVGYVVGAWLLIHWDARPKIDVWVTLQQAADGIAHGQNIYSLNWHDSPGVQDSFTYLPFTALLLAPGRWLAGDVRWALVVLTLAGVAAVYLLGSRSLGARSLGSRNLGSRNLGARSRTMDDAELAPSAAQSAGAVPASGPVAALMATGAAVLVLLMPGTPTQVEQAWTEPLLMACLAGWALGVQRRIPWLAVLCLALGLASKQHLVLLLPMLAAWPRFGWRKTLGSAVLAGVFVLPWFVTSPKDMIHDTVTVLINFQPLRFADTLFIAATHELNWTPPFWITGALVIAVVAASAVLVHRRNPDLATVLRWAALMLFVANLVNKQAFYNQYWLVAALVVLSLAAPKADADRTHRARPVDAD